MLFQQRQLELHPAPRGAGPFDHLADTALIQMGVAVRVRKERSRRTLGRQRNFAFPFGNSRDVLGEAVGYFRDLGFGAVDARQTANSGHAHRIERIQLYAPSDHEIDRLLRRPIHNRPVAVKAVRGVLNPLGKFPLLRFVAPHALPRPDLESILDRQGLLVDRIGLEPLPKNRLQANSYNH